MPFMRCSGNASVAIFSHKQNATYNIRAFFPPTIGLPGNNAFPLYLQAASQLAEGDQRQVPWLLLLFQGLRQHAVPAGKHGQLLHGDLRLLHPSAPPAKCNHTHKLLLVNKPQPAAATLLAQKICRHDITLGSPAPQGSKKVSWTDW